MSDLINCVLAVVAHVKAVRAIDDYAVRFADILIRVDDSFRDDDGVRIVLSNNQCHHCLIR